jgi:hypothetical protein
MKSAEPTKVPDDKLRLALLHYAGDLYDPSAAQFRRISTYKVTRQDGSQEIQICGEMNAKNRLGAYVGYKSFMIVPDPVKGGYWVRGHYKCPE